jgi:mRNA-degrading endonuclease YafQ of YafQ-DinJ toxin-antitoxin module
MKQVSFSDTFTRHFKRRANSRIKRLYRARLMLFLKDPFDPSLRTHALRHGWEGHWSFSLDERESGGTDYRVVFTKARQGYRFVDFGTHDQLYRPWRKRSE